jgi:hypothetical protein
MAKSTRRKINNVLTMPTAASTTAMASPSHMEIADRAFALYCGRGGQDGHDVEDWLRAERELRDTQKSTAA